MKSDLREFVVMDRLIHEPARLLIITLLYLVATMDFLRLRKVLGYTPGICPVNWQSWKPWGTSRWRRNSKASTP
jgi:hypothetical protein